MLLTSFLLYVIFLLRKKKESPNLGKLHDILIVLFDMRAVTFRYLKSIRLRDERISQQSVSC